MGRQKFETRRFEKSKRLLIFGFHSFQKNRMPISKIPVLEKGGDFIYKFKDLTNSRDYSLYIPSNVQYIVDLISSLKISLWTGIFN